MADGISAILALSAGLAVLRASGGWPDAFAAAGVAAASVAALGSGAVPAGLPIVPPPQRLSETGLYRSDGTIDRRCRPFVPQYPLWSDGATKSRWIRLPEGSKIDVSDIDAWRFPPGTMFWKEFTWAARKVETRMIRVEADGGWTFATYVWNEEQTDALLAPEEGVPGVFEIEPGKSHSIPALSDCATCHRSSPAVVLGFNALQLSDDRDPLAVHGEPSSRSAVTLRVLVDEDRLQPPRPDLVTSPPRIQEENPTARAALGYLSGNCGGCHNLRGPLARLGFSFLHEVAGEPHGEEPALATALDVAGRYVVPGVPADTSRIIAPGAPERSAMLHRMKSRRPSSQMPPLGTVMADQKAIELMRQWIEESGRSRRQ